MQKVAELTVRRIDFAKTAAHEDNPRVHPPKGTPQWDALRRSLVDQYFDPLVWNQRNGKMVSGHYRRLVLMDEGFTAADMVVVDWDGKRHREAMLAANVLNGEFDDAKLLALVRQAQAGEIDPELTGYTAEQLRALIDAAESPAAQQAEQRLKLAERFGVPPFSVLDARSGYWQDRKQSWVALGIRSEIGRGENAQGHSPQQIFANHTGIPYAQAREIYAKEVAAGPVDVKVLIAKHRKSAKTFGTEGNIGGAWTGTSIFDPVLTELCYRWFCPPNGRILDPFAGGSVRGVVAGWLGRRYTGIDLRAEQVSANREQWADIEKLAPQKAATPVFENFTGATPFEQHEGIFFKREDLFMFGGANGGKVRVLLSMIPQPEGCKGIVTCGDRVSTMISRAAQVAKALNIGCVIHTATGDFTPGMIEAKALGAEIVQHEAGRLSVVKARAREDAEARGFLHIPWALECHEAIAVYADSFGAVPIPEGVERLVVPIGSGMALAGVLAGMARHGIGLPVLGVQLGGDVAKRLDGFAKAGQIPADWRDRVEIVPSPQDFHDEAPQEHQTFKGVGLDPFYEAKCVPHLQRGDCLWIVGMRSTVADSSGHPTPSWVVGDSRGLENIVADESQDFVFTCPPYFDLEVYSDDPSDLSTAKTYADFIEAYRAIIAQACDALKPNRFAAIVVGDIRDDDGCYQNFVSDTIAAFEAGGARLYNEAILVTACGTLPIRIGKQFTGSRKLGKTHQNVLVFIKGDARKATSDIGAVEFGDIDATLTPAQEPEKTPGDADDAP